MVDFVSPILATVPGQASAASGVAAVPPTQQIERFSSSLQNALPNATVSPAEPGKVGGLDAAARARRALELEATKPVELVKKGGDSILDGLQKLRGVFDHQQARINQAMSVPSTDMRTILGMQMEVAHYNMLVEMTSKLAGKSTSALDTLMKG